MSNAQGFLNFMGGGGAGAASGPTTVQRQSSNDSVLQKMLGSGGTVAPSPSKKPTMHNEVLVPQDFVCQRCPLLEADKRSLNNEIDRLRLQLDQTHTRAGAPMDESERRRAEALQQEVLRLRDQLANDRRRFESEMHSRTEQVRSEVERRMHQQIRDQSAHVEDMEQRMRKARVEMENLLEENRKLRIDLDSSKHQTTAHAHGGTLDLTDIFPVGIELSSLKRSEWRRLFEQLVAELVRRKRTVHTTTTSLPRSRSYTSDYEDVRARVDKLWRDSYRPSYTPPPPPTRGNAEDFLRWGSGSGGNKRDADDFLRWGSGGGGGGRSDADAFLAFSGGGNPHTRSADDFLKFSGGGGGGGGGGGVGISASSAGDFLKFGAGGSGGSSKNLSSDADAFLSFAAKR